MSQVTRFQQLVADAKQHITEVAPAEALVQAESGVALLIDVRETEDWQAGHVAGAQHLSRGVIELEIEELVGDLSQPIICYCGGGSRSALVAQSLQKMGFTNVRSMAGGFAAWKAEKLPVAE